MKPLLIVPEDKIRTIAKLDLRAMKAIERAFADYVKGRAVVPTPIGMVVPESEGELHVKTAWLSGSGVIAIKVATGFYGNAELGLANSNGLIVLVDAHTGEPHAVLHDNGYLTDLRTALAGAIAAKYLGPHQVETVAVLGTGTQARFQLRALRLVRDFSRVVIWGRNHDHAARCGTEMAAELGIEIAVAATPAAAMRDAQLVVTATASRAPMISAADLNSGMHITAMGSDDEGKQELAPLVLVRADRIVCDSRYQCERLGELQHVDNLEGLSSKIVELGAVITGTAPGRTSSDEITVCDLTGVGVLDTAIAEYVYKQL